MLVLDAPPHKTVGMAASYKAERVRTLRKALGLDQKDLAEAAGTDQGDISRIERGATKRATGVNAERRLALLAKALRTTVEDIYERVVLDGPEYHPDPPEAPPTLDARGPMEAALLRLIGADDGGPYNLADLDEVRRTIHETAQYMEGSDPEGIVRSWLRSARYFRLRGVRPTPTMIVARAQAGFSMQSEQAQAEATERVRAEGEAKAREVGAGGVSPRAAAARQRAAATVRKSGEG